MKALIATLILSNIYAFNPDWGKELPKCDSLAVRLAKEPIKCQGKVPNSIDFDLPEHQLNLEDLEKIFQGAESSGGRLVGPMNTPRIGNDLTPFPFRYSCDARLLSDGDKKLSWISFQQFLLTESSFNRVLYPTSWVHRLTASNDIDTSSFFSVPATPAVKIPLFEVKMDFNEDKEEFIFDLCEVKSDEEVRDLSCTSQIAPLSQRNSKATMVYKKKLRSIETKVDFTLKVNCRRF